MINVLIFLPVFILILVSCAFIGWLDAQWRELDREWDQIQKETREVDQRFAKAMEKWNASQAGR